MTSPAQVADAARRRYCLVACLSLVALLASSCATAEKGDTASTNHSGQVVQTRPDVDAGKAPSGTFAFSEPSEDRPPGGEAYSRIDENPFLEVARAPLSTFSIDVDTAS